MGAMAAASQSKREGDISDSFASLAGIKDEPLPDQFRLLKLSLVEGHEDKIKTSWNALLERLRVENDIVAEQGSNVIPELHFDRLQDDLSTIREEIKKRGAVVIRGVIPEQEARGYKFELDEYIRKNPHTKGFPAHDPQVWELYWSAPQLRARTHPNFMVLQKALMRSTWNTSDPRSLISISNPISYADRLRIRQPGDATFALGPHVDGGSVERWMPEGYGLGGTYDAIFRGDWESQYDPWDASTRVNAVNDLYNGLGACSAFRAFQGWMSISKAGPKEGTLLVNPLLKLATSYALLRPFFQPRNIVDLEKAKPGSLARARFLAPENWEFTSGDKMTSEIPGATPGYGMEFPKLAMHPHLELDRTMVHVPHIKPGDYVAWHCDSKLTIHAVDFEHKGKRDSSVLYIPICPATEINANYVVQMRDAWTKGTPGPDFPGGKGESEHVDRPDESFLRSVAGEDGPASVGLEPLVEPVDGSEGEKEVIRRVNKILGF
ncbi:DUF1479-domain-containing protein [Cryphonectria parasitica EP155]|uniref:DUF1479-domain-containing protein n=1 Tax=Cryphonectria parasitica (strain ATCC 38755 / EP155) TaxID=660469 RepID=A0A9P5CMS6_CRYP1|nr:DUF1479-domain-containing protein [Cryphonectria parasitica EP155]KAF3763386.1 DUF1479-domain-containing protein [Cryphonectria parasitica EP155]